MNEEFPRDTPAWAGHHLGERTLEYQERDAILYALAVGASPQDLDLVFEERLRVLPTFGLTLAQWAPDVLADAGAFDNRAVHGSQSLQVHDALPASGAITMSATVANVWDKGSAAIFDVEVISRYFTATWSIFAPGHGGFDGDRGPRRPDGPQGPPSEKLTVGTAANQAALYRLLGDRHDIHIDPEAAHRINQPRPILHGLCTLAAVTLPVAKSKNAHPADLRELHGRFAAPMFPGDEIQVNQWNDGHFEAASEAGTVIAGGYASFNQ